MLVGIGVAIVGLFILLRYQTGWWEWFEPFLTLLTLGTAVYVLYTQLRREWQEYLPNRLTVHFYYSGQEVMRCEKAYLANESDIRPLAQQIGMQMAENTQLKFKAPQVVISPPQLNKEARYIHYEAIIHLLEPPNGWKEGQIRVWREPFDEIAIESSIESLPQKPDFKANTTISVS